MLNAEFWKKYFTVYDALNELYPYQDLASAITSRLDVRPGEKVLDVGSGTGNIACNIKTEGVQIYGIDISPVGVAMHRQKDPRAQLVVGDISQPLPYEDSFFDKVYSNNTLYTIPRENREEVFKEMYRVLKPSGKIVISNVIETFSPLKIYIDNIKISIQRVGLFKTIFSVVSFMVPTIKIFYYNYLINKEHATGAFDLFKVGEQKDMLKKVGFSVIEEEVPVYSNQALLSTAIK